MTTQVGRKGELATCIICKNTRFHVEYYADHYKGTICPAELKCTRCGEHFSDAKLDEFPKR